MSDPFGEGCVVHRGQFAAAAGVGKELCISMYNIADDVTDVC